MKQVRFLRPDGTELCLAQVADNPLTRMRGLLGRKALAMDEGLYIKPCSSIHMFFMRFAIDVVYLSRDLRVVKVATVPQWHMSSGGREAKDCIELAAGRATAVGLMVGETLEMKAD